MSASISARRANRGWKLKVDEIDVCLCTLRATAMGCRRGYGRNLLSVWTVLTVVDDLRLGWIQGVLYCGWASGFCCDVLVFFGNITVLVLHTRFWCDKTINCVLGWKQRYLWVLKYQFRLQFDSPKSNRIWAWYMFYSSSTQRKFLYLLLCIPFVRIIPKLNQHYWNRYKTCQMRWRKSKKERPALCHSLCLAYQHSPAVSLAWVFYSRYRTVGAESCLSLWFTVTGISLVAKTKRASLPIT